VATSTTQKLYCYVDETGQDTKGDLFLVALVITGSERDEVLREAERIEERRRIYSNGEKRN
jgi:hypothetical protein